MKDISRIAYETLFTISNGNLGLLNSSAITALLSDFQYVWLKEANVDYKYEMLDIARSLLNGQNKEIFKVTNSKSIEEVRRKIRAHLGTIPKNDNRVILSLHFKENRIDAKWIEKEEYAKNSKHH